MLYNKFYFLVLLFKWHIKFKKIEFIQPLKRISIYLTIVYDKNNKNKNLTNINIYGR